MSAKRTVTMAAIIGLSGCGVMPQEGDRTGPDSSALLDTSKGISASSNVVVKVLASDGASGDAYRAKTGVDADTDVELTSAFLVLKSIKFFRNNRGSVWEGDTRPGSTTLVMKGPFIVDLLRGTITTVITPTRDADDAAKLVVGHPIGGGHHLARGNGVITGLELPEGTYDRFKIKLEPLAPEDAPTADHPMIGLSIHAVGSVNGTSFEYCGDFQDNLEFHVPDGIAVTSDGLAELGLVLDPRSWFVDLAALAPTSPDEHEDDLEFTGEEGPCDGDTPCRQWATHVVDFSSQYSATYWSAEQALHEPNTMDYGDFNTAWATLTADGAPEYLTVGFDTPLYATGIVVRETWGNGFLRQIEAIDDLGTTHLVWDDVDPSQPGTPVDFLASFAKTEFPVQAVTLHIDPNHSAGTWEEVDAVELLGSASNDPPDDGEMILICGEENLDFQEMIRQRMRDSARWRHDKYDEHADGRQADDDHEERDD